MYPKWFTDEVERLEQDLADGYMSFTDFNKAMDNLEKELYEYDERDYYGDDYY